MKVLYITILWGIALIIAVCLSFLIPADRVNALATVVLVWFTSLQIYLYYNLQKKELNRERLREFLDELSNLVSTLESWDKEISAGYLFWSVGENEKIQLSLPTKIISGEEERYLFLRYAPSLCPTIDSFNSKLDALSKLYLPYVKTVRDKLYTKVEELQKKHALLDPVDSFINDIMGEKLMQKKYWERKFRNAGGIRDEVRWEIDIIKKSGLLNELDDKKTEMIKDMIKNISKQSQEIEVEAKKLHFKYTEEYGLPAIRKQFAWAD
jgi:hypothetical protein